MMGFELGRENNLRNILVGEVVWLGRFVDGGKVRPAHGMTP